VKRIRIVSVAAALLALVGLTTACQPHTGAAAYVGGTRISEKQLDKLVKADAAPFTNSQGQQINPRTFALTQMIEIKVLDAILAKNGGAPTADELTKARATFLGTTTTASVSDALVKSGFKAAFLTVYLDTASRETVVRDRFNGVQSQADADKLTAAINSAGVKVQLNPTYGTWSASQVSITGGPRVGDFLRTSAAPTAAG
jgi:hypothetical protein